MVIFAHTAGSYRCASWCQVETAWCRLVRGVRLAPDRSHGLRGGMRRMGATCTAAQTHMHPQRIPSQEYDQNGAESGGGDALPSEWRRCASQRPIAWVAAGGSARFRLLICGRRSQHATSAKIGATFWPHERQAPIIRPASEGGDCEAGRLAEKGEKRGETICVGTCRRGAQFLHRGSGGAGRSSYRRIPGAARGGRGGATASRKRAKVAA